MLSVLAMLAISLTLYIRKERDISTYIKNYNQAVFKNYETIFSSFNKVAIGSFYGVINKPDIIDIFKDAHSADIKERAKIRRKLYKKLKPDYRHFRMLGVKQVQFHLPDTTSFLRMNKSGIYGDKLGDVRKSVAFVAKKQLPIEGFERGEYISGYRFIYPLFSDETTYIGSVGITFGASAFIIAYEQSFNSHVNFILKDIAVDDNSKKEFDISYEYPGYYYESKHNNRVSYNDIKALSADELKELQPQIREGLESKECFSLFYQQSDNVKILTFVPLHNVVSSEINAYFVIYSNDNYIGAVITQFYTLLILSAFLIVLIFFIIARELHSKHILQEKVEKRTIELNQRYLHERYLKELLHTITDVNESLISSFSLGSVIESSIDRLSRNDRFKLITYDHIEDELLVPQYIYGDIYGLFDIDVIDTNNRDITPIMKSALEAVKRGSVAINTDFDQCDISSKYYRYIDEYDIHSSISFTLQEPDSDKPFAVITLFSSQSEYDQEEVALLENLIHDMTMALSANKQKVLAEKLRLKQISNYEETILAFVDMIEQRDAYTAGHTLRVAKYARLIATAYGLEEESINKIEQAAILHDIGKISTPDSILLKPGKLNVLEYNLIQNHVNAGVRMLSKIELYRELSELIKYHHERYDGKGYPNRTKGENIPVEGHILMVADAFDAMTSNRIYKVRKTPTEALDEIVAEGGKQFHPEIAKIAHKVLSTIEIQHTTQLPQNELEQQRFAYFFKDNLTGIYNESYLQMVLNGSKDYEYMYKLSIKNFSAYNKKYGWSKGDDVLIQISDFLQNLFPDIMMFRYHGDEFLILLESYMSLKMDQLEPFLQRYPLLGIEIDGYDSKEMCRFSNINIDEY
jgi:putative nucleotidyltransferase with HDIG domain